MDRRRNSGSYARPDSQYHDYDRRSASYGAPPNNQSSFSARAGRDAYGVADYHNDPRYAPSLANNAVPRSDSRRVREPQAALHVPKPRAHLSDSAPLVAYDKYGNPYDVSDVEPIRTSSKPKSQSTRPDRPTVDTSSSRTPANDLTPISPSMPRRHPRKEELRRDSVPDRSPLQKLEVKLDDISKEEKRARMEEAEYLARQKAAGDRPRREEQDYAQPRRASGNEGFRVDDRTSSERRNVSAPLGGVLDPRHPEKGTIDFGGIPYESEQRQDDRVRGAQEPDLTANQRFRRAQEALKNNGRHERDYANREPDSPASNLQRTTSRPERYYAKREPETPTTDVQRTNSQRAGIDRADSKKYRHRSRDAGYAGAERELQAATAVGLGLDGAERKEEDRRRSVDKRESGTGFFGRSNSKKLQKRNTSQDYPTGNRDPSRAGVAQQQLQSDRAGATQGLKAAIKHQDPDPLPPEAVRNPYGEVPKYQVPPQTAGGQDARGQVGFDQAKPVQPSGAHEERHHRTFDEMFHHHRGQERRYERTPGLEEWRKAATLKLAADDLDLDDARPSTSGSSDQAWWERNKRSSGSRRDTISGLDGIYEEEATSFRPPLYVKCGPLLRYTGMRRERLAKPGQSGVTEREIWRGSVMIVTVDNHSSYETVPTLRLFAQPMDLLPPPPARFHSNAEGLPSEYVDPLAGQVKLSRTGQPLFVKPVEQLEEGVDLSRVEDNSGLFESTKSPTLGPQQIIGRDGQQRQHITTQDKSRIKRRDGEKLGKYREVKAARLHSERGVTFWRFNLEVELASTQMRVAYRINRGPAIGFWVPARGQTMNIMFHSCNGFSLSVDSNLFSGPDPLWRDVLNTHQIKPFHVMLGGGDQIYNDAAMRDTKLFGEWLQTKNPEHKHRAEFSYDMQEELENFYLDRYSMWFSQGLFGMANSQIPMVNIWDDHDIIDGYGSYPHHFMSTKVFTGLGAVAFKYYMLFQHQSVVSETQREEPSWLLGASPGPYINELSRSLFMFLGHKVAFLGLDCRTERMRDEVLSQDSYDIIFDRCRAEIKKGDTKHLIVLLGVPIAYPRLNFLENILTSRVMDPIKAIGRTGALGGFVNRFDGGVEILDDLDDHWTAKHHKAERNWFVQELQELASEKSIRITILGGDVHLGAVGQFYTKKKLGVPKDRDHRYMPNIISSAIVNTPPPNVMADVLNRRNKTHHLDDETDEDMIPMFDYDVDGKSRNNRHLLPRRNYCTIREYLPGSTPPPTPPAEPATPASGWSQSQDYQQNDRRYPPGSMKRTFSFGKGSMRPGNLIRRLSGSRSRNPPVSLNTEHVRPYESYEPAQPGSRRNSMGAGRRSMSDSYFPQGATADNQTPVRPTNMFHRRPTDLSEKAAAKAAARGGPEGNVDGREHSHIDLEGGLDICLNMEVSQKDPAGITVPYRLLVPALWYEGEADENDARAKTRTATIMDRIRGRGHGRDRRGSVSGESYSGSERSRSRSRSPTPERTAGGGGGILGRLKSGGHRQPAAADDYRPDSHDSQPRGAGRQHGNDGTYDTRAANGQQRPYANKEYGPAVAAPTTRHPAHANKEYGSGSAYPPPQQEPLRAPPSASVAGPVHYDERPREPKRRGLFGRGLSFRRNRSRVRADNQDYERDPEYYSDETGSYTGSEDERYPNDMPPPPPATKARRPSKAERFFGIGDEREGPPAPVQRMGSNGLPTDEGYDDEGRKKGWRIWK